MADNMDFRRESDVEGGEEVYSKAVRAGRRTYFFDVKATRNDDYFLTITESRKKQMKDGSFVYDKHKLYLYKEDFAKFSDGLEEVISYIKEHKPEFFRQQEEEALAAPAGVDEEFERL
ncbi:MAG: PUR family DNA/RNA-binding protein [Rikenellaceae bacterium]|nr:PUR family DNA/RNA-binding protein [Rikenellaceae bacterium]